MFTPAIVKGLRTGAADRNADGEIDANARTFGRAASQHREGVDETLPVATSTPRTHRPAQDWVTVGRRAERSPARLTTSNGRTGARRAAVWAFSYEPPERPRNTSVAA